MKFSEYLINEKLKAGASFPPFFRGDPKVDVMIYENPTASEIENYFKEFKKDNPDASDPDFGFRGMFDTKGNLLVWLVDILHDAVMKKLNMEEGWVRFEYHKDSDKIKIYLLDEDILNQYKKIGQKEIAQKLITAFPKAKKDINHKILHPEKIEL